MAAKAHQELEKGVLQEVSCLYWCHLPWITKGKEVPLGWTQTQREMAAIFVP